MKTKKVKYEIGYRIKECRKKCDLSQKELAEILHIKNTTLSNWEQGVNRPDIDQLCQLCKVLYVTPSQLLGIVSYENKLETKDWKLINAYHSKSEEIQKSVDILLDIR